MTQIKLDEPVMNEIESSAHALFVQGGPGLFSGTSLDRTLLLFEALEHYLISQDVTPGFTVKGEGK